MTVVSVYAVFADSEEADRIGRQMVEERLAACVNLLGSCRSIYRWQGAVETAAASSACTAATATIARAMPSGRNRATKAQAAAVATTP